MFETFEKLSKEKQELIISVGIKEFSKKSYKEVSTEDITKGCGISKGILFHYFGSKKEFYFYCLNKAMERLVSKTETETETEKENTDFYEILFLSMDKKISLCMNFKDEMHMVNMAARDVTVEIAQRKAEILQSYMFKVQSESAETLKRALRTLKFKQEKNLQKIAEGLSIYINAVLNKYLAQYQIMPDEFFKNTEKIKAEIKEYLDLILFGVCEEE